MGIRHIEPPFLLIPLKEQRHYHENYHIYEVILMFMPTLETLYRISCALDMKMSDIIIELENYID